MRRQTTYQEATPASLMKLLQSDKAKERSSGRKGLEQLLQLDKRREKLTTKEYSDMLRACITFENHEIHAAVKSIRAYYDTNNALFFKSVCKAHHAYGDVSPTKVTDLLNHLISVIRDERVPLNYRNIYVDILLDVGLDFKYAQTIHEESFGLCRALFCDIKDSAFLVNIFKWFHSILDEVTGTTEQYKYLCSICDSCSILLGYHGMSHYAVFVENLRLPLQRAIQQLLQLQGSNRQSVYRLISKSFDFFRSCRIHELRCLDDGIPVYDVIDTFCSLILSEDYIRAESIFLGTLRGHHGSSSKDSFFFNFTHDKKALLGFKVAAKGLLIKQQYWKESNTNKSASSTRSPSKSPSRKHARHDLEDRSSAFQNIFDRLQSECPQLVQDREKSVLAKTPTSSSSKINARLSITNTGGKQKQSTVLEGHLMLLYAVMHELNPSSLVDFLSLNLKSCKEHSKVSLKNIYCEWINVLLLLLIDYSNRPYEIQIHGYLLLLLQEFAKIPSTSSFISSPRSSGLWKNVFTCLIKRDVYFQYINTMKKNGMSAVMVDFFSLLVSQSLLEHGDMLICDKHLAMLPWIRDPMKVEVAECIGLVASFLFSREQDCSITALFSKYCGEMGDEPPKVPFDLLSGEDSQQTRPYIYFLLVLYSQLYTTSPINLGAPQSASTGTLSASSNIPLAQPSRLIIVSFEDAYHYANDIFRFLFFSIRPTVSSSFHSPVVTGIDTWSVEEDEEYVPWIQDNFADRTIDFCLSTTADDFGRSKNTASSLQSILENSEFPEITAMLEKNSDVKSVVQILYSFSLYLKELLSVENLEGADEFNSAYLTSIYTAMVTCIVAFSNFNVYAFKCIEVSSTNVDERSSLMKYVQSYWDLNILMIQSLKNQYLKLKYSQFRGYFDVLLHTLNDIFGEAPEIIERIHALNFVRQELKNEVLQFLKLLIDDIIGETGPRWGSDDGFDDDVGTGNMPIKRVSSTVKSRSDGASDDFDDFMDSYDMDDLEENGQENNGFMTTGSNTRLIFTKEQSKLFSIISRCYMIVATDCDGDNSRHGGHLSLFGKNQGILNLSLSTDFLLQYCSELSTVSSAIELFEFLHSCSWQKSYGSLGYCKVLEAVCLLTKRPVFFDRANPGLVANCANLIFWEHGKKDYFANTYWKARRNQLKGACNLVSSTESNGAKYKDRFAELIRDSLFDIDLRVRLEACASLPILLRQYRRHENIYDSILSTQIQDEHTARGEMCINYSIVHKDLKFWSLVTVCVSCGKMGAQSSTLRRLAVIDILKLCCTRFKTQRNNKSQSLQSSWEALFLKDFMKAVMTWFSRDLGYENTRLFFVDNVRWLMNEWLEKPIAENSIGSKYNETVAIEDFPHFIFGFESFSEFIVDVQTVLIPIICQLQPPQYRWHLLLRICNALNYGDNDFGVTLLLMDNLASIKVLETMYACLPHGDEKENADIDNILKVKSDYVFEFCSRTLNDEKVSSYCTRYKSDLMKGIFTFLSYEPVDGGLSLTLSQAEIGLRNAVKTICMQIRSSEDCQSPHTIDELSTATLLSECNLVDIVALLHIRVLSTQSKAIRLGILAAIGLLSEHQSSVEVSASILHILSLTLSRCPPGEFTMLSNIFDKFATNLLKNQKSYISSSSSSSFMTSFYVVELLFTEICSILIALDHKNEIKRIPSYLKSLKHITLQLNEEESAYALTIFRNMLLSVCMFSSRISNFHSSVTSENRHFYLPINDDFINRQSVELMSALDDIKSSHCTLVDIIEIFPKTIRRVFEANPVPKSFIWLHVSALKAVMEKEAKGVTANRLWRNNNSSTCEVVSTLVEILSNSQEADLNETIIFILGSLGSVDFHSLQHGRLPYHHRDPYRVNHFKVEDIKVEICMHAYKLMWDSSISTAASAKSAMKSLKLGKEFSTSACNLSRADVFGHCTDLNMLYPMEMLKGHDFGIDSMFDRQKLKKSLFSNGRSISIQDPSTWNIDGTGVTDWKEWICRLVPCMILDCYCEGGLLAKQLTGPSSSSTVASATFFQSFLALSSSRSDVAELLFPLMCFELIKSLGTDHEFISRMILSNLMSEKASIEVPQATRLAIRTIVFIFKEDVSKFVKNPFAQSTTSVSSSSTPSGKKRKSTEPFRAVNVNDNQILPFDISFKVDFFYAAKAALRSGCITSAMMLFELYLEQRRFSDKSFQEGSDIEKMNEETNVLLRILLYIHDLDAVHAINQSHSLESQGAIYAHDEKWLEALTTIESVLQSDPTSSSSSSLASGPHSQVVRALMGLGCNHTLLNYISAKVTTDATSIDVSIGPEQALKQWSLDDGTERASSATSTRSLTSNILEDFDQTCSIAIKMLADDQSSSLNKIMTSATKNITNALVDGSNHESAKPLVAAILNSQQLLEIYEVKCLISRISELELGQEKQKKEEIENLLHKWNGRLDCKGSTAYTILSNRLSLLANMLDNKVCTEPIFFINLIEQIHTITSTKASAHSFSPLIYQIIHQVKKYLSVRNMSSSSSQSCAKQPDWINSIVSQEETSTTELIVDMTLQECKLLWNKGLYEIAVSSIRKDVITPLKVALDVTDCALRNVSPSSPLSSTKKIRLKDLLGEALMTCGKWMSERKSTSSIDILEIYLKAAVDFAQTPVTLIKTSHAYADFNFKLYQEAVQHVQSSSWIESGKVNEKRQLEIQECDALYKNLTKDLADAKKLHSDKIRAITRYRNTLSRELESDKKERTLNESSVSIYLLNAVKQFSVVLLSSPSPEIETVFKIINLWFTNNHVEEVNDAMKKLVDKAISYKFIPLIYQIFSRIGMPASQTSSKDKQRQGFQSVLIDLVIRMASDHPYHTLPQLFALANEDNLGNYVGAAQYKSHLSSHRINVVNKVLQKLRSSDSLIVDSHQALLSAYNDLATASTANFHKRAGKISFKEIQHRGNTFLDKVSAICKKFRPFVISSHVNVRKDATYAPHVVRINHFVEKFSISETGVSRPKIIECVGTDGNVYKQLVKGGDDTRQDAVMQQVFEHVNTMFRHQEVTRTRRLSVRTYKVLPLTPQTGVIEWVKNTIPFGAYLTNSKSKQFQGAHERYYPQDLKNHECRELLKDGQARGEAFTAFVNICERFHPVFRFFFLENFSDPSEWMASRLAFTRSVATTAIVGWVLGVGDRHAQNILIDSTNGEVVQIDFGIVFEQGKHLGIPETVPFRLTRDIVDGFGVNGCEGTFRRCSEQVLSLLREKMNQVLEILEVVIHDPLYKWSISPLEANKRQRKRDRMNDEDDECEGDGVEADEKMLKEIQLSTRGARSSKRDSSTAEKGYTRSSGVDDQIPQTSNFQKDAAKRTLTRIRNKLQGFDDNSFSSLSVEGFVQLLITEAQDKKNLSKVFPGWAPWL